MLHADGDMETVVDDTDLSPWQETPPPEDWKPPAESVAFLKDMMNKGSIPVGVIVPDYDPCHYLWPPYCVSGHLPNDEAKRILFAFALGYKEFFDAP
jgi:hypothetical protein